jgi:hypothetical protein
MIGIVFSQIVEDFQEAFVQNFLSLFGGVGIAQAYTFGIPEELLVEMSLCLVIAGNARCYDRIEVVFIEGYFSSK